MLHCHVQVLTTPLFPLYVWRTTPCLILEGHVIPFHQLCLCFQEREICHKQVNRAFDHAPAEQSEVINNLVAQNYKLAYKCERRLKQVCQLESLLADTVRDKLS